MIASRALSDMTLVGSLRFARHDLLLWLRTWYGSAFSILVAPVLYLAGIGLGIGQLVNGGGESDALAGLTYAAFAGTGVLAGSAMQNGVGDLSWPVVGAVSFTRTWHASASTPLAPADLVGGKVLTTAVRLALSATVFAVALVALGLVPAGRAPLMVLPAVLGGIACGTPVFALAAHVRDPAAVATVFRFVVVPLFILSGTFFPVDRLPAIVQPVAALSPLWHAVELVRGAGLGTATAWAPWLHVMVLVVWAVAGLVLAARTLTARLRP